MEAILENPEPYVWITGLGDFAVEYTLHVFTDKTQHLSEIDATLKRTVLETCKQHKIDISTPRLIQRVGNGNNGIET